MDKHQYSHPTTKLTPLHPALVTYNKRKNCVTESVFFTFLMSWLGKAAHHQQAHACLNEPTLREETPLWVLSHDAH